MKLKFCTNVCKQGCNKCNTRTNTSKFTCVSRKTRAVEVIYQIGAVSMFTRVPLTIINVCGTVVVSKACRTRTVVAVDKVETHCAILAETKFALVYFNRAVPSLVTRCTDAAVIRTFILACGSVSARTVLLALVHFDTTKRTCMAKKDSSAQL